MGIEWAGKWPGWVLSWLSVILILVCPQPNWSAHPVVKVLLHAGQVAAVLLAVAFAWNQWHHQFSASVLESAFSTLLFGWAGLTFAYGRTKAGATDQVRPSR